MTTVTGEIKVIKDTELMVNIIGLPLSMTQRARNIKPIPMLIFLNLQKMISCKLKV